MFVCPLFFVRCGSLFVGFMLTVVRLFAFVWCRCLLGIHVCWFCYLVFCSWFVGCGLSLLDVGGLLFAV